MNREPHHRHCPWLLPRVTSLALIVGLAACAGSTTPRRPAAQDSGASPPIYYDSGSYPAPADGASPQQLDSGAWPTADYSAPTGNLTCGGIWNCYDQCSDNDDTCTDACYNKGTAAGQAKMDALEQCWTQAEATTCAAQCASTPDSQACFDCEDKACATQLQACN